MYAVAVDAVSPVLALVAAALAAGSGVVWEPWLPVAAGALAAGASALWSVARRWNMSLRMGARNGRLYVSLRAERRRFARRRVSPDE